MKTGSRRGLFQCQVVFMGLFLLLLLFVYAYISHGITVLVFNDM